MTNTTETGAKDFSKTIRATLKSKGIAFMGTTWLPGTDGSYANGVRGYILNDGGTQRLRTYSGVVELTK